MIDWIGEHLVMAILIRLEFGEIVVTSTLEIPVMSQALSISGVVLLFTIVTVQTPVANEQEVTWADSSPARAPIFSPDP